MTRKIKKVLRTVRRYAINGFTVLMLFVLLASISAVDSNSWIPYAGMAVSLPWLLVYAAAVGAFSCEDGGDDE